MLAQQQRARSHAQPRANKTFGCPSPTLDNGGLLIKLPRLVRNLRSYRIIASEQCVFLRVCALRQVEKGALKPHVEHRYGFDNVSGAPCEKQESAPSHARMRTKEHHTRPNLRTKRSGAFQQLARSLALTGLFPFSARQVPSASARAAKWLAKSRSCLEDRKIAVVP